MNKNIFIDSNLKAVEMFGCKKKSEMVNRTPVNFSPAKQPDGQNSSKKAAKYIKLAFSGHPQRFYWQHKKKDGSLFDTEISLNRFILKGEVYLQAIGRDISDRKKAEEKLMLSEKKYHTLINLAVDGILLGSHEGIIMEANESMCVILGMAKKDFIGKHVSKLPFTKDSLKKYPLRFDLLKKGKVVITNRVFVRPNGTKVTVEMHSKMMPDGTYHSIYRDITKRQKIEQKIKENEEKYRLLFETANDGIAVIQDGLILYGNKAIGKMYGASVSKMIGHKFTEYIAKEEMSKLSQYYKMRVAGKNFSKMYETILMNKNGKRIYVELSAARIVYNNKPADHIILRNITERKQAEEKIIENEEKYRRLFESTKDSILILNAYSGEITDVNPFIEELLGYSKKELIGKKIFEINLFKDIIQNKKKFIELKEKKYVRYDNLTLQTKLGIKKYVEFVSNVYLVGTKKVIQCNIRDFTEKIQKEKELDQVKNDFLSLTSHQLRTPLSATKWVLEILKQDLHFLNLKQQQKFEDLIVSNERLINLVNRLLDVTRIESGKLVVNKKNVDLRKLIDDLCESFKILADNKKKNIKIIAPQNLKDIYCDPVLITEAIGNLLNNAINYSLESSKEIIIKIEDRKNDYLITIHNEGNIDPSSIKKIKVFNKFVRGKNALEIEPSGSGLGLYITKKVIEANGGDVWFESETKSGTNFYLVINKK